jgi:hypothetical protein
MDLSFMTAYVAYRRNVRVDVHFFGTNNLSLSQNSGPFGPAFILWAFQL